MLWFHDSVTFCCHVHVAVETQGAQVVTSTQAELGTEVDPSVGWEVVTCMMNLPFRFLFYYRDISHNEISTLEDGIFDNLFNLSEM